MKKPFVSQAVIVITVAEGGIVAHSAPVCPPGDETSVAVQLADRMVSLMAVLAQESGSCDTVTASYHGPDPDLARTAQEVMEGQDGGAS